MFKQLEYILSIPALTGGQEESEMLVYHYTERRKSSFAWTPLETVNVHDGDGRLCEQLRVMSCAGRKNGGFDVHFDVLLPVNLAA